MRPTDLLPPDVATALEAELPSTASGARVAEWLAEAHRAGRIGTSQLCEAVGALEVELPEGAGADDPVVLALIGRGAMGEVHLARDDRLARHVAVKRVTLADASDALRAQFTAEARILAQLDHPSIPPIYPRRPTCRPRRSERPGWWPPVCPWCGPTSSIATG